jgi:hypothetical protein
MAPITNVQLAQPTIGGRFNHDLLSFMANAVTAVIAVVGTLLGSALTYLFQSKTSERAEASALQREIRAERVRAYGAYSTALTEFIRGQLDLYYRRAKDPDSAMTLAARFDSYRLKGVAQTALLQVRFVASYPELADAAGEAFESARKIRDAQDKKGLIANTDKANEHIDHFVALAAADVRSAKSHAPEPALSDIQDGYGVERERQRERATDGPDVTMISGRSRSAKDRQAFMTSAYITAHQARETITDLPSW